MKREAAEKWLNTLPKDGDRGLVYNTKKHRLEIWLHRELYQWVDLKVFFDNPLEAINF